MRAGFVSAYGGFSMRWVTLHIRTSPSTHTNAKKKTSYPKMSQNSRPQFTRTQQFHSHVVFVNREREGGYKIAPTLRLLVILVVHVRVFYVYIYWQTIFTLPAERTSYSYDVNANPVCVIWYLRSSIVSGDSTHLAQSEILCALSIDPHRLEHNQHT